MELASWEVNAKKNAYFLVELILANTRIPLEGLNSPLQLPVIRQNGLLFASKNGKITVLPPTFAI